MVIQMSPAERQMVNLSASYFRLRSIMRAMTVLFGRTTKRIAAIHTFGLAASRPGGTASFAKQPTDLSPPTFKGR
jgi:hypothetical protein